MSVIARRSSRNLLTTDVGAIGWRKVGLACGVASFFLYVGLDTLAALLYDGYSYRDQTISELSAVGAPTRALWLPLGSVYAVLLIVFGAGIRASAERKRVLRVVAFLVAAIGVVGLVAWPLAPMHQREVLAAGGGDWRDTMHIALSLVDAVLFMSTMVLGALALGRWFRLYSIATIAVVVVFGFLTGMESPGVQDNDSTPWLGVYERVMLFASMLWLALLGIALLVRGGGDQPVALGVVMTATPPTRLGETQT